MPDFVPQGAARRSCIQPIDTQALDHPLEEVMPQQIKAASMDVRLKRGIC
jgi:hypothetical protein